MNPYYILDMSSTDPPTISDVKVVTLDHHSLSLSWSEGDEQDTPVTGYVINFKSSQDDWEELKIIGKRSSCVLKNLRCGTKYQMTVTAYNKAGRSKPSDLLSAATAGNGECTFRYAFREVHCLIPVPKDQPNFNAIKRVGIIA